LDLGLTQHLRIQSPRHTVKVANRGGAIVTVEILFGSADNLPRFLGENSLRRLLDALIPPWAHIEFCAVAGGEEHSLLGFGSTEESTEDGFGLCRSERETLTDLHRRSQVAEANDGDGAQRKNPP
jgi:hypothetical protein